VTKLLAIFRESFGVDRAEQVADRAVNVIRDDMLGQQPAEPPGAAQQPPRVTRCDAGTTVRGGGRR